MTLITSLIRANCVLIFVCVAACSPPKQTPSVDSLRKGVFDTEDPSPELRTTDPAHDTFSLNSGFTQVDGPQLRAWYQASSPVAMPRVADGEDYLFRAFGMIEVFVASSVELSWSYPELAECGLLLKPALRRDDRLELIMIGTSESAEELGVCAGEITFTVSEQSEPLKLAIEFEKEESVPLTAGANLDDVIDEMTVGKSTEHFFGFVHLYGAEPGQFLSNQFVTDEDVADVCQLRFHQLDVEDLDPRSRLFALYVSATEESSCSGRLLWYVVVPKPDSDSEGGSQPEEEVTPSAPLPADAVFERTTDIEVRLLD